MAAWLPEGVSITYFGMALIGTAKAGWLAVTEDRLMIAEHPNVGSDAVGELLVAMRREVVQATLQPGLMNKVEIVDTEAGETIGTVSFGIGKKKAAQEFLAALQG